MENRSAVSAHSHSTTTMPAALFRIERKKNWQIGMACVKVELSNQNRKAGATLFAMNKITQDMRFKQAVIEYSFETRRHKGSHPLQDLQAKHLPLEKEIDGTLQSLADRSLTGLTAIQISIHRPRSSSSRTCAAEILTPVWWSSG